MDKKQLEEIVRRVVREELEAMFPERRPLANLMAPGTPKGIHEPQDEGATWVAKGTSDGSAEPVR